MYRAIGSFKSSVELLGKNPWIFGIVFFIYILALPVSRSVEILFNFSLPLNVFLIYLTIILLAASYIGAGFIGIVKEAVEGVPSLETFKLSGRKHFPRFLMGIVIFFILWTVYFLGTVLIVEYLKSANFFAKINVLEQYPFLEFLILFTPVLFTVFFIQFFDVGIVVDGYGVQSSFKRSIKFVKARKLSVLVYDLISVFTALFLMSYSIRMNLAYVSNEANYFTLPLGLKVLRVIITLFISTIHGAIQGTYHIVYYVQARADDSTKLRP